MTSGSLGASMAHCNRNADLEADNCVDWSLLNRRLESFRGSGVARRVSAERLARAGFYFTGDTDRVRCFSCMKTVENWCRGDIPVERHKEVSPSCTFLSCTHRASFNPGPSNGSSYDEDVEDMEFRLRRGEVVDESRYPMVPHMSREDARHRTYAAWPSSAPVRPRDLAQAGLYYLGESDRVQCFCCGGMLAGWEAGDTAWEEHSKHFPYCFFILGHDVGNVPAPEFEEMETAEESVVPRTPSLEPMESFEERLNSFTRIQHPINSERLARAGFYSAGIEDRVKCFRCGGGLKGWQPEEDPWEEHARHYPGCSFLLAEKGPEFVNTVQLQAPQRSSATSSQNGFSHHLNGVLESDFARRAIQMGFEPTSVERTILEKLRRTGSNYSSLEALVHDCLQKTQPGDAASSEGGEEDPLEKLRKLQREKQCKICMDRDISVVFIPCGHLVSCKECSESLSKCPICCGAITQKLKTYIA